MEELLSGLNKFNVKTEEELFTEQFSKLSADSNTNKSTENQPFITSQYTTHKMFGKDVSHSKKASLNQGNININFNTNATNDNTWQHQFETNNIVGWNQTQKANDEEEGWGNLPDVNTSVDPNHTFGMSSILSAEILNLGNANVNQQRVFGSGSQSNNNNLTSYTSYNNANNTGTTRTAEDFKSSNQ
jgi:hypothetical protein